MTSTSAGPVREAALKYLWMHNRSWVQTGEEGGPRIVTGGEGVKVVDSDGRTWIDVNGGYNSVNVGYGRTEIAEAAEDQMRRIAFYPVGTAIPSTIELCERLAELNAGHAVARLPGQRRLGGERDRAEDCPVPRAP